MLKETIRNNNLTKKISKAVNRLALADIGCRSLSNVFSAPRATQVTRELALVISGPAAVKKGTISVFEIVGFSPNHRYIVSSTCGQVSLINNIITFLAPLDKTRAVISINGYNHHVNIVDEVEEASISTVKKPMLNVSTVGCTASFSTSSFSTEGLLDHHRSTDWQLSPDIHFKTIIASAMGSTICKTSWSINNLPANTLLYIRARHKGEELDSSEWSDPIKFITRPIYIPSCEEQTIIAPDASDRALLGVSVTMSADGKTVATGSHGASVNDIPEAGKVHVFSKGPEGWKQEALIIPKDSAQNNWFGHAIAMDPSGTTLVIGAYGADVGEQQMAGKVYVYTKANEGWSLSSILTTSEATSNDAFGFSVAISGDGNKIISGAYMFGSSDPVGRAYIFTKTETGWIEEAILGNPDRGVNDQFGWAVAIDKFATRAYVTAPCADQGDELAIGKVHIYYKANMNVKYISSPEINRSVWHHEATIVASDAAPKDHFGWSLAINDDSSTLIITSPYARSGRKARTGKAYIYTRSGSSWCESVVLYASDETANSKFGISVAMNGYGDKIIISASHADNPGVPESGKVYVFIKEGFEWVEKTILTSRDKEPVDLFGSSVAMDAVGKRMVISSPLAAVKGLKNAGKAHIFS